MTTGVSSGSSCAGLQRVWAAPVCFLVVAFLAVAPAIGSAQTATVAPLPSAAQESLDKGIVAAKVPDYPLAIRYFEGARKLAPAAPVVFMNLGIAESKMPGRELRAIAWFGVYLAAYPDAPNAAAVKEQIAALEVRNKSNVSRLIKAVQDAASQMSPGYYREGGLRLAAVLWSNANDFSAALKAADLSESAFYRAQILPDIAEIQVKVGDSAGAQKTLAIALATIERIEGNENSKAGLLTKIATVQTQAGDIAGAQKNLASAKKTADLVKDATSRASAQKDISEAQANSGNITGAQNTLAVAQKTAGRIQDSLSRKQVLYFQESAKTAIAKAQIKAGEFAGALKSIEFIDNVNFKVDAYSAIAKGQAKAGDFAGAQKTADLVPSAYVKSSTQKAVAEIQSKIGIAGAADSTRESMLDTQPSNRPVIAVSDWIRKLDDDGENNDCPLNTGPFLDLARYLKSRPAPDTPQKAFDGFHKTAKTVVTAQNILHQMLKPPVRP